MKQYGSKKQSLMAVEEQKGGFASNKNSGTYWNIFNIKLFGRDKSRLLNVLEKKIALGTKKYWIATVNPEFIMEAQKDVNFKNILGKTDLNVVDGIGLVWARELTRQPVSFSDYQIIKFIKRIPVALLVGVKVLRGGYKDQVASGADLIVDLVKIAKKMDKKIFLLGGWENRAEKTAEFLMSNYLISNKKIEYCKGEPGVTNSEVVKKINNFKPDILLVAYGMKKQEFWIYNNIDKLNVGLVMGVGRSFDYYSGALKRAPGWARKMGMEWLYSLIKEPKRLKRQMVLPRFVWKILKS